MQSEEVLFATVGIIGFLFAIIGVAAGGFRFATAVLAGTMALILFIGLVRGAEGNKKIIGMMLFFLFLFLFIYVLLMKLGVVSPEAVREWMIFE